MSLQNIMECLKGNLLADGKSITNKLQNKGDYNNIIQGSPGSSILNIDALKSLSIIFNEAESGSTPVFDIEDQSKETDFNELVPPFSLRSRLVEKGVAILKEKHCLNIFGGLLSGKSTLGELIAKQFPEHLKIKIDCSSKPENILILLKSLISEDNKIIVLDNCPDDVKLRDSYIKQISKICNEHNLIITISTRPFNPNTVSTRISDIFAEQLSLDELKEMLPPDFPERDSNFIYVLTGGNPALTHLACIWLKNNEGVFDMEAFSKIISVSQDQSIQDRVYQTFQNMVKDENDIRLLNRLLLYDGNFSEKECRQLAEVTPTISSPLMRLNRLSNYWVSKNGDGKYIVAPIVRKTMKPDLNFTELAECTEMVVAGIFAKKVLDPHDIFRIIYLLNQAELYTKLSGFYTNILIKLSDKKIINHPSFKLILSFWVDTPLPQGMETFQKASMRIIRVIVDPDFPYVNKKLIADLREYLPLLEDYPLMQWVAGHVLQVYYATTCQHQDLLTIRKLNISADSIDFNQIDKANFDIARTTSISYFSLYSCKTFEDLESWIEVDMAVGCPRDPQILDLLNLKLFQFSQENSYQVTILYLDKLYMVCEKYGDKRLLPTMAFINFHKIRTLAEKLPENQTSIIDEYNQRSCLMEDPIGCFLLNAIVGISFYECLPENANAYLNKALEINVADWLPMLNFKIACFEAQLNPQHKRLECFKKALNIAIEIQSNKLLSVGDKITIGSCLGYGAYIAEEHDMASKILYDTTLLLLSAPRDEEFKICSTHLAILTDYIHREGKHNDKLLDPNYTSPFIRTQNIETLYDGRRILGLLINQLNYAASYSKDNALIINLISLIIENFDEFADGQVEILTFLVPYLPILLDTNNEAMVKAIVSIIDNNVSRIELLEKAHQESMIKYFSGIRIYYELDALAKKVINPAIQTGSAFKESEFFQNLTIDYDIIKPILAYLSLPLSPSSILSISILLYSFIETYWQIPASLEVLAGQLRALMVNFSQNNPSLFNGKYQSLESIFNKINVLPSSKEYIRRLIVGFYYHLQTTNKLDEQIKNFCEEY